MTEDPVEQMPPSPGARWSGTNNYRPLRALPGVLEVSPDRITCKLCGRAWRRRPGQTIADANYNYLCEHIQLHKPIRREPPPRSWPIGDPPEAGG